MTCLNCNTSDLVAELPVQDFMVLSSTKHLLGILNILGTCVQIIAVSSRPTIWHMRAIVQATSGTLASCGSGKTNVGVSELVQDATVTVLVVTSDRGIAATLTQRNGSLQDWALHVVDENGEVASRVVVQLASIAGIWSWVLRWCVGVLAVTTGGDVSTV